jgi:hypothetical protein
MSGTGRDGLESEAFVRVKVALDSTPPRAYQGMKDDLDRMGTEVSLLIPKIKADLFAAAEQGDLERVNADRWADWVENFRPDQTTEFEQDIENQGHQLEVAGVLDKVEYVKNLKVYGRRGRALRRSRLWTFS